MRTRTLQGWGADMVDKVTGLAEAMDVIKDGDTIMIGGFTMSGCPWSS